MEFPRFEKPRDSLEARAVHLNPKIRKAAFEEYFEKYEDLPYTLFNNSDGMDERLAQTLGELAADANTPSRLKDQVLILQAEILQRKQTPPTKERL